MATRRKILALVGCTALAGAGVLAVGCGGETTLAFTAKITGREVVDLGEPGSSHGDLTAIRMEVLAEDGSPTGHIDMTQVVTFPTAEVETRLTTAQVEWNGTDDSLIAVASPEFPIGKPPTAVTRLAVTGGTGQYAGRSGEAIGTPNGPGSFRWEITLK